MVGASAPRRRVRWRRWVWAAVAVVAVAALVFVWLRPRAEPPQRVYLESVRRTAFVREVSGTGSVRAARSRALVFPGSGTVAEVAVAEGDRVDAGTVLARLDTRNLERELASDRAALDSARADLERSRAQQAIDRLDAAAAVAAAENRVAGAAQALADARSQLAAALSLFAAGGVSRNDLDAAGVAVDQAERQAQEAALAAGTARARVQSLEALAAAQLKSGDANVRRLETAIANLEQQRTDAALVAPFAGVVAQVPFEVGDPVAPAAPQGISLVDDSSVSVLADFDENRAVDLAAQQEATVTPDADPELALPAVVTRVDPVAARAAGGSATLRAELGFTAGAEASLPREAVRPGYTVTARVVVRRIPDVLVVPLEAIGGGPGADAATGGDGGGSYVFRVVQGEPSRGVAQRVAVTVLDRNATLAAVDAPGLSDGDWVAATNIDALGDGEGVAFDAVSQRAPGGGG